MQLLLIIIQSAVSDIEKTGYNYFIDVVVLRTTKHNTIYTNGNINVIKIHKLANFNSNSYFAKRIEHTNNITNNITRHDHNNLNIM